MSNPLVKKLLIKPGYRICLVNAPDDYAERLGDLPDGVEFADRDCDFVQLFVKNSEELEHFFPHAMTALKQDAVFWASYPKISSKVKTDLTRDRGWEIVIDAGFQGVGMVAIDEIWSAMRFVTTSAEIRPSRSSEAARHANNLRTEFEAELKADDTLDVLHIQIPFSVKEVYGTGAQMRVKGTIDGIPFQASLAPYSGAHYMGFSRELRVKTGKKAGDTVYIIMEPDPAPRVVMVPDDLAAALEENPKAKEIFDKFAYTHRKEYVGWIESAKKQETRERRIAQAVERIAEGRKFS